MIFDSQLQEIGNHLNLLQHPVDMTTEEEFKSLYQQVAHKIKKISKTLLMKISEIQSLCLMSSESKTDQISQFSAGDLEMQHQVNTLFQFFFFFPHMILSYILV